MLGDSGASTDVLSEMGIAVFGFCDGNDDSGLVVIVITFAVDAVYVRMGVVEG